MGGIRFGHLETDLEHDLLEERAVLAPLDRLGIGTDQTDAVLFENSRMDKGHGGVQGRLTAEGRKEGVRFLPFDDLLDDGRSDRLDVGPERELRIGHDGGRIGVHQYHIVPFLSQSLAGLNSGVVELASLADHDGAGADEEDFVDRGIFGHGMIRKILKRKRTEPR